MTVLTEEAPAPVGAYSQGRRIGPFLQVSGQVALDGDIATQTRRALGYVRHVLRSGGADWADVLTVRVHIRHDEDFDRFDEAYRSMVPEPFPARVVVGSEIAPGALVEIDALAVVPIVPLTES